MAALPWWTWLAVGLFVSIASSQIGGKLVLFIWLGVLFVIVGIVKLIILIILAPKEKLEVKPAQQAWYCPRCRGRIQLHDVFCKYCGLRLR